ncbi:hypothetical protein [Streptosporangium longisporum]|uniref:hypothetical protein n=1 Tax=Streptosporangium longisporum TaxID=46187 RepID=UPI0031EFADF6
MGPRRPWQRRGATGAPGAGRRSCAGCGTSGACGPAGACAAACAGTCAGTCAGIRGTDGCAGAGDCVWACVCVWTCVWAGVWDADGADGAACSAMPGMRLSTSRNMAVTTTSGEGGMAGPLRSPAVSLRSRAQPPSPATAERACSGQPGRVGSTVCTCRAGSTSLSGRWSQRDSESRASLSQTQSSPAAPRALDSVTDDHQPAGSRGSARASATCWGRLQRRAGTRSLRQIDDSASIG